MSLVDHHTDSEPYCPYCGALQHDYEFKSVDSYDREEECEVCGKSYLLDIVQTVEYTTKPMKEYMTNDKPPITEE